MIKRVFVDVAAGLGLAIAGQFLQFAASLAGPLLGLPMPYESAPEDGTIPAALLDQINAMFWLAAAGMIVLSFLVAMLLKTRAVSDGLRRGAVWVAVVGLSQFLLSLGNGMVPVFGLLGTWAYLVAVFAGPVLAGLLGSRRRHDAPVAA
ncbi:hypothetical protein [Tessaracoccus sp. Z1128]